MKRFNSTLNCSKAFAMGKKINKIHNLKHIDHFIRQKTFSQFYYPSLINNIIFHQQNSFKYPFTLLFEINVFSVKEL